MNFCASKLYKEKKPCIAGLIVYNTSCFSFPLAIKVSINVFTTSLSCSGIFSMVLNWFRSFLLVCYEATMLKTKYLHSKSSQVFMQKIDCTYNVRGWLTGINNPGLNSNYRDQFGMQLFYSTQSDLISPLDNSKYSSR